QDITEAIRSDEVTANVSALSTRPQVRELLVKLQQQAIESRPRIVVEGRDITTVVAPDADARILLTASPEVRMARRRQQLRETDQDPTNVESDVMVRDAKDSALVDFMTPAEGVAEIDSTNLSLEENVTVLLAERQRQVNDKQPYESVMTEEEFNPSGAVTVHEDLAQMTDEEHHTLTQAYLAGLQQYDLQHDY